MEKLKSNELRPGNYIEEFIEGEGFNVIKVSVHNISNVYYRNDEGFDDDHGYFNSIPMQHGFFIDNGEKDENGDYFIWYRRENDLRFYPIMDKEKRCNGIQVVKSYHAPISEYSHIRTVHQFQNLFQALTGNDIEIEVNLKRYF